MVIFLFIRYVLCLVAQLCPTLCDPMDSVLLLLSRFSRVQLCATA